MTLRDWLFYGFLVCFAGALVLLMAHALYLGMVMN